jgi:hypothetical protein
LRVDADYFPPSWLASKRLFLALRSAGVPAENCIRWAPANDTCGQGNQAKPSPEPDIAGDRQAKQHNPQGNTRNAVDTAYIGFHHVSFKFNPSDASILGVFVHVPNEKHDKPRPIPSMKAMTATLIRPQSIETRFNKIYSQFS